MDDHSGIYYAQPSPDCVVFRIEGRGDFHNSIPFKKAINVLRAENPQIHFILDMENCASMDSTFMGVLAGIGSGQRRERLPNLMLVNVSPRVKKLLDTLGLSHFLDIRQSATATPPTDPSDFEQAPPAEVSKKEQIVHMIEAHQELINVESENQVKFQNVLKYLNESLEKDT